MGACFAGFSKPTRPKSVVLKYFQIPGRGEPIRLLLCLGDIRFKDDRITASQWEEQKKKWLQPKMNMEEQRNEFPYGQVPVLIVDGKILAQTKAIIRYVGKIASYEKHCLYPTDALLAAKVDDLLDAFDDLWMILAPTFRIVDPAQKEATRKRLFAPGGQANLILDIFEGILSRSSNGFLVPEASLSIADVTFFCFLNMIRSGFIEGLGPDLGSERKLQEDFPRIWSHKEKVAAIPKVRDYYASERSKESETGTLYEVFREGK